MPNFVPVTDVRISARIPRGLEKEIESLMREEHPKKSAALRELLHLGVENYPLSRALADLAEGRVSLYKAAQDAGLSIWEFLDETRRRRVTWVDEGVLEDSHGRRHR